MSGVEAAPIAVAAPPSKSVSHRAVIAAALARGTSRLGNVLESDDLERTMDVLRVCGAAIVREAPGTYVVTGVAGKPQGGAPEDPASCFMGESGTSCRLLTAVLAAGTGAFRLHGAGRLHERPMLPLTEALHALGASFRFTEHPGFLPCVLETHGLRRAVTGDASGYLAVDCSTSSQFLSGLLLAGPMVSGGLTIGPASGGIVSWPYVGITLGVMESFGCAPLMEAREAEHAPWREGAWRDTRKIVPGLVRFTVPAGAYAPRDMDVEGDYSGASYLLAAGAIGPKPVTVSGLNRASAQGDAVMLDILERMGARVVWSGGAVTVYPSALSGLDVDMGDCPDLVPTVAALARYAVGPTRIRNVAHLKAKESDRLAAVTQELCRSGACAVHAGDDGLTIVPGASALGAPGSGTSGEVYSAHGDHRIAMALALLELDGRGIVLDNPACVSKSFPDFWTVWRTICPHSTAGNAA